MSRRSANYNPRQHVYRLKIVYEDVNQCHLGEFRRDYMAGEPVHIEEKIFTSNGKMLYAPEVVMTMPRHAVEKTVTCRKCGTKRKPTSRHDV